MTKWTLDQSHFLTRRSVHIYDRCVETSERNPFGGAHLKFAYEEIPEESFQVTTRPKIALWAAIVPGFFTLMLLGFLLIQPQEANVAQGLWFWGLITIIAALQYTYGKKSYIGYNCNGRLLLLLADKPTRDAVQSLMAEIQLQRNRYLHENYAYVEPGTRPVDELQRLSALHVQGVISKEEMEQLKHEILTRYTTPSHQPPVGQSDEPN